MHVLRHANLLIRERPAIGFGSLLSVEYAGRIAFRAILTPRKTDIDALAEDAAQLIARRIVSIDLEQSGILRSNVDFHGDGY